MQIIWLTCIKNDINSQSVIKFLISQCFKSNCNKGLNIIGLQRHRLCCNFSIAIKVLCFCMWPIFFLMVGHQNISSICSCTSPSETFYNPLWTTSQNLGHFTCTVVLCSVPTDCLLHDTQNSKFKLPLTTDPFISN